MRGIVKTVLILLASVPMLIACEPEPQPVQLGSDQCEYCRMIITEPEFASQVLNNQGRSFKFDSIECMAAYNLTADQENIHSYWVPNFTDTFDWLAAEEAHYLHSETLRSPMGLFLSAYPDRESAEDYLQEYKGNLLLWDDVRDLVREAWLEENGN